MAAYRMKPQRKRSDPYSGRCKDASTQVADNGSLSRHTVHLPYYGDCVIELKMVKHLRRHDDVHACIVERQTKRIATSDDVVTLPVFRHKRKRHVKANCPETKPEPPGHDLGRGWNISAP